MTKIMLIRLYLLIVVLFCVSNLKAQNPVNWTEKQLIEPSALAENISTQKDVPIIISIGPGAIVPNSIAIGMVNNPEGMSKLKEQLKGIPKDKKLVIYCGCCP